MPSKNLLLQWYEEFWIHSYKLYYMSDFFSLNWSQKTKEWVWTSIFNQLNSVNKIAQSIYIHWLKIPLNYPIIAYKIKNNIKDSFRTFEPLLLAERKPVSVESMKNKAEYKTRNTPSKTREFHGWAASSRFFLLFRIFFCQSISFHLIFDDSLGTHYGYFFRNSSLS